MRGMKMFRVSGLKTYSKDGWTYLSCDFDATDKNPFKEKTMWVAVEDKNADMLTDDVYDTFVLLPVFFGMYYGQDVHIDGDVSPRLYHNMQHYIMNIFDRFSDKTKPIRFTVKGLKKVERRGGLIGTGISCGVDSMVTIYDNYVKEEDPDYKINSLFFVNCETHKGADEKTHKRFTDRVALNREAAKDLGLPMYVVNSNFHAFTPQIGEQKVVYLAIYSCILSLQKCIRRYYTASCYSYDEIVEFFNFSFDFDIAEHSESYLIPLIETERFELVIDGCQYARAEKLERFCEWEFAQKHLNVCIHPLEGGYNCSVCTKCLRTLLPLEAMGKLDNFSQVFDLKVYKKKAKRAKWSYMYAYGKKGMETSVVRYAKAHGMKFPPKFFANCIVRLKKFLRLK